MEPGTGHLQDTSTATDSAGGDQVVRAGQQDEVPLQLRANPEAMPEQSAHADGTPGTQSLAACQRERLHEEAAAWQEARGALQHQEVLLRCGPPAVKTTSIHS